MRETVIVNDGELNQEIGAPYFFQDNRIRDLNKDQITQMFRHTHDLKVKLRKSDPDDILHKVGRGLNILGCMLEYMYDGESGHIVIHKIKTNSTL